MDKTLRAYLTLSEFAKREHLQPGNVAGLMEKASLAFKAGEREANTGKSADGARRKFEESAESCGYGTEWSGLMPVLIRNGRRVMLPSI